MSPQIPFLQQQQSALNKPDKSKKGKVDEKIQPLLELINRYSPYYTTSSCSGRIVLWRGSGKKNELEWLNVSHDLITSSFFDIDRKNHNLENHNQENSNLQKNRVIWLRLEPLILHVACQDLAAASLLLDLAKTMFKKSCLLTVKNKIIVEIRGSQFVEMPFFLQGMAFYSEDPIPRSWLVEELNTKLKRQWQLMGILEQKIKEIIQ